MEAIVHGIILAFGLILPLGVQNVFVFSQGATQPKLIRALPATITAALCDTFLILLAVFGLSIIVLQFEWLRLSLMIVGILFLLYMGYAIWRSEPTTSKTNKALPIRQQIIFALSVSLLNPHAHFRYSRCYWDKCIKICRNGTSYFYNHMYYSILGLVLWVNARRYSHEEDRWNRRFNEHIQQMLRPVYLGNCHLSFYWINITYREPFKVFGLIV